MSDLNILRDMDRSRIVPTLFLTGKAGTGKTTLIQKWIQESSTNAMLTAVTGIAAVNLGGTTINSVLRYYDLNSLIAKYNNGDIHEAIMRMKERYKNLVIEECPMMPAEALDIIYNVIEDCNKNSEFNKLGLILLGDLGQLPPIKGDFIFKAECWPEFAASTVKLEKVWRQDNLEFLEGLNLVRAGNAQDAVKKFVECGVQFVNKLDENFEGTTIISENIPADKYNQRRLAQVPGPSIDYPVLARGKQLSCWGKDSKGNYIIPRIQRFKIGCYVTITANDTSDFRYANGDCGHVVAYLRESKSFQIKLVRNKLLVTISAICRTNMVEHAYSVDHFVPYEDEKTGMWIIGDITYLPLKLGYAFTIHKAQGLTLDNVQLDITQKFFGSPNMAYVGLSRARTPEGLRIIGTPALLASKIKMDPRVKDYI